jgi:hypothetical protein
MTTLCFDFSTYKKTFAEKHSIGTLGTLLNTKDLETDCFATGFDVPTTLWILWI